MIRFALLVLLASSTFLWAKPDTENLRQRLKSRNSEIREGAYRDIIAEGGDVSLLPDIYRAVKRDIRSSLSEADHYDEMVMQAVRKIAQADPEKAAPILYKMIGFLDAERAIAEGFAREFLALRNPIIPILEKEERRTLPNERHKRLCIITGEVEADQIARTIPWLRRALQTGNEQVVFVAAESLRRLIDRGLPRDSYQKLKGIYLEALKAELTSTTPGWERSTLYLAEASFAAFGPSPELTEAVQTAYARVRRIVNRFDNHNWVNTIRLAQGKPIVPMPPHFHALDTLDLFLQNRRSDRNHTRAKETAAVVARALARIDPIEANDYLTKFMQVEGDEEFQKELVRAMKNAEGMLLPALARRNALCLRWWGEV